jgi:DNA invertase Pin-like site-specific DNA recombinase
MMKVVAVGYVRVSTEEQSLEGVSIEAQKATLQAYATMRGIELIEIVTDEGVSGGKELGSRPGGSRVVELATKGKVQAIISCKLDRLFRDASDCLTTTKIWDRKNVALHLVDVGGQSIDTSSTMGRFFLTMLAGVAEMERNMICDRTQAAMNYKKANNEFCGNVPFGMNLVADGKLVPNVQEQVVITRIKELRSTGLSYRDIATAIENEGHLTKQGKTKWTHTTIKSILTRAA